MTESVQVQADPGPGAAASELAHAKDHARRVVEASGTSFFWGMRILPKPRREAMYAIYAFCREVDDIADRDGPIEQKRADLAAWRQEIETLYAGRPSLPTSLALLPAIEAFDLPKAEFLAVLDGMEMDAREAMVAPAMDDLLLYCRRVAGAVGMLSIHAFGDTRPAARDLAVAEGEALQLTNILRDLAEDAERGRLYLPAELLDSHGMSGLAPSQVLKHPELPALCRSLAARAGARFSEARDLLAQCDRQRLRPATLMLEAYSAILARLVAADWRDPLQRVSLPKAQKLWLVLRYGLL